MNPACPPHAPARRAVRGLAALLLLCASLATAVDAHADGCDGCPAPTLTDLQSEPGFKLETRRRWTGGKPHKDQYYLDKGECSGSMTGIPDIQIEDSWLVLRATGEVWNCPHSRSTDTITVESSASDSTAWSFKVKLGTEVGALGAKLKHEVEMGNTTGTTVTEVTRISKTITPTFCHRVQWKAYFQVAKVKATGTFAFKQRWAWWTKNATTGSSKVHASGDIWMDCGGGTLELTRKAPIAGHFDLTTRACDGPECAHVATQHLGLFPPWPQPDAPDDDDAPLAPGPAPDADGERPDADGPASEDAPDAGPADAPDDGVRSSADLGNPPAGPATDPQEPTP